MGDGAKIDKQAASNALAAWHTAATDANDQFAKQSVLTNAALDSGSWIGDDDAGSAFKGQFNVSDIQAFLTTGTKQSGQTVTAGVVKLGDDARTAIENSLTSDEQQRQQMDAARKQSDSNNNTSSSGSSGPSSSAASSSAAASPSTGADPTSATTKQSPDSTATDQTKNTAVNPDLFKGSLQWGVEGADGKWHALPAHADLNAKEYQGNLQWGVEGSDGKWYPLPANERPTALDDRGPLADLQPASEYPTATDDRGPLMHIVSTAPSEVVGHHGQLTVDPQWRGRAADTIDMSHQRTNDATTHHQGTNPAVTSAEAAPGQPATGLDASSDTLQQGVQHAAVSSAETAPGAPTPIQDYRDTESPTES
jgi:hypothetical protein